MRKLVSTDQMRELERGAEALGLPGPALMENAGRAVAEAIRRRYPPSTTRNTLVVVGPGNNGGDGLVVARHLHDFGYRVAVYLIARALTGDAKEELLRDRQVPLIPQPTDPDLVRFDALLAGSDLVVDALLGTGRLRPIGGPMAQALDRINRSVPRPFVVALDLPSGVNADTGDADPYTPAADLTVTLGEPKRGLVLGEAARLFGCLEVADIGLPAGLSARLAVSYADAAAVAALLPPRPHVSHKGSFGRVVVVAGSKLYTGAPVLAARGAARIGAGLVTLACPETVRPSLAAHTVETTFLPLPDAGAGELGPEAVAPLTSALTGVAAVLVGPGIGRSTATALFLEGFLAWLKVSGVPTIVDADALTLLAQNPSWWERLPDEVILTPHPGEMARLTGASVGPDRIDVARRSAATWGAVVVLKGPYTVVARPDGAAAVLPFATAALATAGTGDVLAGAILGLLGQGARLADAALVGGYVHGVAGERVAVRFGAAGGLASDVAQELPEARRTIEETRPRSLAGGAGQW